ncbi:hypothetical protein CDL12_22161 [Handroanthus impetiginosus]|uniref:C2 domain-containing protein n=1 Tax=Handroanthus impetiginosus TaxID=429701 RepID=A0A2G9GJ29_9LAMI|nr:hypothetical protein CDL12_22161 [Handroanthus impetiginosus]
METQILEINLISAQGLKTPSSNSRRMQTYAVTWIDAAAKLRTRIDSVGGENPTWNDKFLFRVTDGFVSGDTSAVAVEIFAVGYIRDYLIGSVRFLLSTCLKRSTSLASERFSATPSCTAVQIRRPSGRFQGVLNIAAAVYYSSDYAILEKVSAVSLGDLMKKKEMVSRRLRRLSRGGSKRSQKSSGGDSCDFSDGADSTTSSSSTNGRGLLCGLVMQRNIPLCPSDQNLEFWADSCEENH